MVVFRFRVRSACHFVWSQNTYDVSVKWTDTIVKMLFNEAASYIRLTHLHQQFLLISFISGSKVIKFCLNYNLISRIINRFETQKPVFNRAHK